MLFLHTPLICHIRFMIIPSKSIIILNLELFTFKNCIIPYLNSPNLAAFKYPYPPHASLNFPEKKIKRQS